MTFKQIISELNLFFCNDVVAKIPSRHFRLWYYRSFMKFEIGKNTSFFMHCAFDSANGLYIGNASVVNARCRLDTRGNIIIGNNVSISQEVIILTADHDVKTAEFSGRNKKVIIEDYVWIGTRVTILPGITIGKGAVIGTGSVVTKNIEPYCIVAGIPAKPIGKRREDLTYTASYSRLFQ